MITLQKPKVKIFDEKIIKRLAVAAVLLIASAIIALLGRAVPAFAEGFFTWSKTVNALYAMLFAWVPVSVAEILLVMLGIGLAVYTARFVRRMLREGNKKGEAIRYVSVLVLISGILCFVFTAFWSVNYNGKTLGERLDLLVEPRAKEELAGLTAWLLEQANTYADDVPRDAAGVMDGGGFSELAASVPGAFEALGEMYPLYKAPFYAQPKRVFSGKLMSSFGIAGIYSPFTAEANVNTDKPDTHIPFTMCHEVAHRLGIAREDEANFSALLACIRSDDPAFSYSGYLVAYIYASNALYDADPQAFRELLGLRSELVNRDILLYNEHLKQYEGPAQEVGTAMNNRYLRTMGLEDGVKSYGRMVDLMLAYYSQMV